MPDDTKITEIFFIVDEFCKELDKTVSKFSLEDVQSDKKRRNKPNSMSDNEIITILILFHLGGYRSLKHFYLQYVYTSAKLVSLISVL